MVEKILKHWSKSNNKNIQPFDCEKSDPQSKDGDCIRKISLDEVKAGQRVRLVCAEAGRGLQGRLTAMGLIPGVEFEVKKNDTLGPVVIALKGTRLMLGRGMTHKVFVKSLAD